MKRIVRQEIEAVTAGVNSFRLTTTGSERCPSGLKITVQNRGVHSYWSKPIDKDGRQYPSRLMTEEDGSELRIRPGDQIELAIGDQDEQGDTVGYAGLYRGGKLYATAVVRHAIERSLSASADGDPAPITIEEVERELEETLKRYNAKRMGGTAMAKQEEEREIRTTFGGRPAISAEDIRQAEERARTANSEAAAPRREPAFGWLRRQREKEDYDEQAHREKQDAKQAARKYGKFDFR